MSSKIYENDLKLHGKSQNHSLNINSLTCVLKQLKSDAFLVASGPQP